MKSIRRLKSMGGVSRVTLPSLNDPDENNSGGIISTVNTTFPDEIQGCTVALLCVLNKYSH